ncbi:hypothetical protein RRG08_042282 [Elysia crispata]|uniref:Uncharacterized protein n=1 Tax=Elysia crispata TaxID=231223 RepID=A0AAE1DYT9_9GAST|nr:hypothetical protein RRG08_042282 [Elysia crispata]
MPTPQVTSLSTDSEQQLLARDIAIRCIHHTSRAMIALHETIKKFTTSWHSKRTAQSTKKMGEQCQYLVVQSEEGSLAVPVPGSTERLPEKKHVHPVGWHRACAVNSHRATLQPHNDEDKLGRCASLYLLTFKKSSESPEQRSRVRKKTQADVTSSWRTFPALTPGDLDLPVCPQITAVKLGRLRLKLSVTITQTSRNQ